jgi:hypothetical protein
MLLHRLDGKVVNLPYIADARDESAKLAERDSLLGIDYYYNRAVICGVQTERSLGQPRPNGLWTIGRGYYPFKLAAGTHWSVHKPSELTRSRV